MIDAEQASRDVASEMGLVLRSQSGDRGAFEEIVRRTARILYSRLYLETGDAHRAEDLVQETYLLAWRSIGQVSDPKGLRPWLFSIAHSALVDAARREGRKKRGGRKVRSANAEATEEIADPGLTPGQSAEQDERRRNVLKMLRSIPEEYRAPLALRYLAGADYETIGQQLGLSNGSLRGLLHRGMARLREKMKGVEI